MRNAARMVWMVLVVLACGRSPYPGTKRIAEEVYLRLHQLGDDDAPIHVADSIRLRLRASLPQDPTGSLLSTERWYAVADLRQGALLPVLQRIRPGDSATVFTRSALIPWQVLAADVDLTVTDTAAIRAELLILERIGADEQARREQERLLRPIHDGHALIAAEVARDSARWIRWGTSMMHYAIEQGPEQAALIHAGDPVSIVYRGERLDNGMVFDPGRSEQDPLRFRFGDPDQVVPGLLAAVELLGKGRSGIFLIPAELAFGDRGIPGLLPPGMPVRYTVQVLPSATPTP